VPTITKKAAAAGQLAEQCRVLYLPVPVLEHVFHPTRKWRFDLAWPDLMRPYSAIGTLAPGPKLAVEIDGGTFVDRVCPKCAGRGCPSCRGSGRLRGGRHNTGAGYRADLEKFAEAIILGWYVLRCLPEQIKSGQTVALLERFFLAHHVALPPSPRPRRSPPQ
jgi:hypothetical protein